MYYVELPNKHAPSKHKHKNIALMVSMIQGAWNSLDDEDKLVLVVSTTVITSVVIYLCYVDNIRTTDEFIAWLASWLIWIIRKVIYFIRKFIEEIIKGLKDAFTKPI
ncbi:hypothetical protein M951_chr3187 (nucleomorph) [Lotharella oceanica]|uniref:Uncharacterized protein n=1 Tax=Lotharella oceanica TaxID=641309 RepID=A0A060DBM0_9EUKA|nr:hypothetical protein M951_chr118 [Lotharella oceanica]AIB09692.1 hypothetical protein M951_chr1213 [Lotharella oceanica]AIB09721.1 hypothetical protein M951_chr218 [Lotharella oceanica]AIB09895.1 hypothetical protein M951_chr2203 [Lotharella oceanica]AIB09924.1 hypothetical protein M951_chr318 [Lotharella oceanica]